MRRLDRAESSIAIPARPFFATLTVLSALAACLPAVARAAPSETEGPVETSLPREAAAEGGEVPTTESYRVKAAMLLNFARFTEWPKSAFATSESPIVIAVIGNDQFSVVLDETLQERKVGARPVIVARFETLFDLALCHLLFLSPSLAAEYDAVVERLKGTPTVTVGDTTRFAANGGILGFLMQANKVRFEVNRDAIERAGVKVSSKLLALEVLVPDAPSRE